MWSEFDLAITGSGFGGSLLAMIARRLGRSVVLIEKGTHPRMAIGESSTPLANLLLEELSVRYDLPFLTPFAKWGSWQRAYPEIACGLKRGFTFLHHDLSQGAAALPCRAKQLLVAASPHDAIADTHWFRADFDYQFVRFAQALGAESLDEAEVDEVTLGGGVQRLAGRRKGEAFEIRARLVIDATGPRGVLHRALALEERGFADYPETQAVYAHFQGAARLGDTDAALRPAPFPIDDAAVHHIFDGGWVWVLQFNNGITSAGVAANEQAARRFGFEQPECAWKRVLERIPELAEQFRGAEPITEFKRIPRLPFRTRPCAGSGWAMLPSAAGFVDPLLSTGFPLTLLGVQRIAEILETAWGAESLNGRLKDYAAETDADLVAAARLIGSLYANFGNFRVFTALTLLYFAAASFSETARRLGKPHLASSFLLRNDGAFGAASRRLLERARNRISEEEAEEFIESVMQAIEPIDVAGLGDRGRRNWYPVMASDLYNAAAKVESSPAEIAAMLRRSGF